jgi:pimeloyl-ACP methyl ester carboxylesterase
MNRVTANGISIAWRETGRGEPPIVVVPQWFLSSRSMVASPLVGMLAKQHRMILYDRRGTGDSDKPGPPYTSARDAKDLVSFLDAIAVEDAVLLGTGVRGSQVALIVAGHIPSRVRALVCIGGTPKWSASAEWPYGIQSGTFHKAFAPAGDEPPGVVPDDPELAEAMREDWRASGADAAMDILHRTLDDDLRPFLRNVTPAALVIHLRGDALVSFDAARWLAESLPAGHLEEFDAARSVPLRAPEALAEHIEEFLSVATP